MGRQAKCVSDNSATSNQRRFTILASKHMKHFIHLYLGFSLVFQVAKNENENMPNDFVYTMTLY